VSKDNIIKLIQPGNVDDQNLAQSGACSVGPGDRGRGRGLSPQACRFQDRERPSARRTPRSPAGTRGDDRYRSDRCLPAACTRSRSRRYRPCVSPADQVSVVSVRGGLVEVAAGQFAAHFERRQAGEKDVRRAFGQFIDQTGIVFFDVRARRYSGIIGPERDDDRLNPAPGQQLFCQGQIRQARCRSSFVKSPLSLAISALEAIAGCSTRFGHL